MKHIYFLFTILFTIIASAQIPSGYYDSATGSGYVLKTQLRNIITSGHSPKSYDQLFDLATGYEATDTDDFYENDGSVMDMYSENPTATDPYNYSYFANPTDKCGNYNSEMDCYNGEHLMPQSVYGSSMPMVGDIHHVIPTDGYVNNGRGSLAFGETNSPSTTYLNGSKRGTSSISGYTGTVFEPIDEFKGDIARCLLYFAVRYENQVASWNHPMLNNTSDQVYEDWFIDLLLDWHNGDAVNNREINRNNASYIHQGNRNPFIDQPEYANLIWNPTPDNENPSDPTNLVASNPTDNSIDLNWTSSTDNVGVVSYDIYVGTTLTFNTTNTSSFSANGLTPDTNYCFTIKAKDAAGNESGFSNQDCETTTNNGSGSICTTETFENIPANNGSYTDRTWIGDNGLQWDATEARTDQTINGRAIAIDYRNSTNGTLTSSTINGGIGDFTVTTLQVFTGTAGSLNLYVNGVLKGDIPYTTTSQTTTISNINIEGPVTVVIQDDNTSGGSARVAIDDISWSCYSLLSVDDFNSSSVKLYPNPVNDNLYIDLNIQKTTLVDIYDILGKKVISRVINTSKNINVEHLNSGIYIVRITQDNSTISRKLIKN